MDRSFVDELSRRLAEALPSGARELQRDLEKNFRVVLQGTFERLDLVTREEFEVQSAVLGRTRAKLADLERRVAELEARLESGAAPGSKDN